MAMLRQGQQWMIDIAHILDAPLPELTTSKPSVRLNQGARVQQQLNRYLSKLKKRTTAKVTFNLTKGVLMANCNLILKQGAARQHENPKPIIPNNAHDIHKRTEGLPAMWA